MSAAKKVAAAALTIGGLPAERFDARRVKVTLSDGITTTGVCRGTYKRFILVDVVIGAQLRQYQVPPSKVKPFWVENPDLHTEAKNLGILFDGDVNVGRALEAASAKASADALAKAKAELAEAAAKKAADAVVKAEAAAVRAVEEARAALEAEAANAAKAEREAAEAALPHCAAAPVTAKPDYASLTGVTASMTADPTWVADFADLQSLLNERKGRHGRIAALQAELASLVSRFEDDEEMIALYAESLLQKGATLHWTAPVTAEPALDRTAADAPKPGVFEMRVAGWLAANRPAAFSYQDVWDATGVGTSSSRRAAVCRCAAADYNVTSSARGKPQVFARK